MHLCYNDSDESFTVIYSNLQDGLWQDTKTTKINAEIIYYQNIDFLFVFYRFYNT